MSKEIILTPVRTTNTENSSMISPNTQTLYAPRADINSPYEYGLVSYSDLGDFTYTQEEIDNKDTETLDSAKGYADSQDAIVLASANEHSDDNLEIAKQHSDNNLETAKHYSDDNLEIAKQHSDNNLETAKNYTDNELLNYYTKVEVDDKNEDVLSSAKNYTYSKEEIDDKDRALNVKIEAVEDKSDGRLKALSFDDNDQIIAWINGTYTYTDGVTGEIITPSDVTIGQNIYNENLVQNDYWVSELPITSINDLSILITDKNELNATDVKFNPENENKLSAANVQDAVDELTEVVENRTAIFELGNFVLSSENWALNSENGLYEYIFTNEALTNAITQIIEFTPNVECAKLINDNNIVIYNNIETINNNGITQAIIRAENKPSFDIVCQVRIKTNALHLTGSAKFYASDVVFKNNRTDLGATDVQNAIVEINNKANNRREITIWEASELGEFNLGYRLGLLAGSLTYMTLSSNIKPDTKYSIEYYVWNTPGIIKKVYFKTDSFGKSEISVRDFNINTVDNVIEFRDVVISVGNDDELDKIKCVKVCQKELNSQGILTDVTNSTSVLTITVSKISEIIE